MPYKTSPLTDQQTARTKISIPKQLIIHLWEVHKILSNKKIDQFPYLLNRDDTWRGGLSCFVLFWSNEYVKSCENQKPI